MVLIGDTNPGPTVFQHSTHAMVRKSVRRLMWLNAAVFSALLIALEVLK